MTKLLLTLSLLFSSAASALQIGSLHLDANGILGSNIAQGTYMGVGADLYMFLDDEERLAAGWGAYFTAGQRPSLDREIGTGPFVSYHYPILDFLTASARQNFVYLDSRHPIQVVRNGVYEWDYESRHGMASITTAGLHLHFARSFVLSGGYRFMLGLNNSDLAKDRSGPFFGLACAI